MLWSRIIATLSAASLCSSVAAVNLDNLPAHPRLMMTPERISKVLFMNQTDFYFRQIVQGLQDRADIIIQTPLEISSANEWIGDIRLDIATVAGIYLLTNNTDYADYVINSTLRLSNLADWGPSNFLHTADILFTVAIGYDWLYDQMSDAQRRTVENSLLNKGLTVGLNNPWSQHTNNWAQVCPTGLIIASLAIGDQYPTPAGEVFEFAFKKLNVSLEGYAPDGGWNEGYHYGSYANQYLTMLLSSLDTALNDDFGISNLPGMSDVGAWLAYGYGQIGGFNWGDGDWGFNDTEPHWCVGYWANRFLKPEWQQAMISQFTLSEATDFQALLFYNMPEICYEGMKSLPLGYQWMNVGSVVYRESWTDKSSWFFGLRGGFNGRSHGHLDAGSFVVDYKKYRWAELLGSENYNLPGYFTKEQRWKYYRCRTEGANTLSISNETQTPLHLANQITSANTSLLWSGNFGNSSYFGVVNLTQAYQNVTTSVMRGVALLNGSQLIIRDEVESDQEVDIVTNWHTTADIVIFPGNKTASLTQGEVTMIAKVLSPAEGFFELISTNPCSVSNSCIEMTNEGIYNLAVRLSNKTTAANITVSLAENVTSIQEFDVPLSSWYSLCTGNCSEFENIIDPYWLETAEIYY